MTDNPWGIDDNKYYIDVGGISDFLNFQQQIGVDLPSKEIVNDHSIGQMKQILKLQKDY